VDGNADDTAEDWFEIARSDDVVSKPVPVRGVECDLVCYRGWSGRLHVVDARCPHMGVGFARHGIVDGEGICCRFHGWTWDGHGRHVRMSWQGRAMAMFDLRSYPVREVDGRVWIRLTPNS
jgi:phenylpropionate dioxygenase-like ring-hydroxylating dioxygenase large terminal subunit